MASDAGVGIHDDVITPPAAWQSAVSDQIVGTFPWDPTVETAR